MLNDIWEGLKQFWMVIIESLKIIGTLVLFVVVYLIARASIAMGGGIGMLILILSIALGTFIYLWVTDRQKKPDKGKVVDLSKMKKISDED